MATLGRATNSRHTGISGNRLRGVDAATIPAETNLPRKLFAIMKFAADSRA
jgi:hypothetical protein